MFVFERRFFIVVPIVIFINFLFIGTETTNAKTVEEDLIKSMIWPTAGDVSDHYGTRGGRHFGIDIAAPEGTPIVSIKEGTISRSYYSDTYGNVIFVKHENNDLETVYAHLHERYVKEGERVEKGQVIGTVGNTGRSSGNHLHFEVHVGEWNITKTNSIDPLLVLTEPNSLVAQYEAEIKKEGEFQTVLAAKYQLLDEDEWEKSLTYEESSTKDYSGKKVTVQTGDTLWSLAQKHEITVAEIKEQNALKSDLIFPGDVLQVTD